MHGIAFDALEVGMAMDLEIEAGEKGLHASRITPHLPAVS
jgi:hypothetical protein